MPEVDRAWEAAVGHPLAVGARRAQLVVARSPGVRRESPVPVARPFALMLDGRWQAAADEWQALGCPMWTALALATLAAAGGGSAGAGAGGRARRARDPAGHPAGPACSPACRCRAAHAPTSRANPSGLTGREIDVLRLLVDGLSNADMADQLFLSEKTVGHHVSSVLHKLGEPTRSRAVATAIRQGIVTP